MKKAASKSTRKPLSTDVIRTLLAKSAGYCQNPACNTSLFRLFETGEVTGIQELAHMVGQSPDGPRGASTLTASERDSVENIILLCSSCHTMIDKTPNAFPVETLHEWKENHERRVAELFSVPKYETRDTLSQELSSLFRQNRSAYNEYGPTPDRESVVLADAVHMWRKQVLSKIIPNNRRISAILRRNNHLLSMDELELAGKFFLHQEGFEFNHLSDDKNKDVPLFPVDLVSAFALR